LIGAIALLLVELDKNNWKKYLRRENKKFELCIEHKKEIWGILNAFLLS